MTEQYYLSLDLSFIWCDLCLGVSFTVSVAFFTWSRLNLYVQSLGTQPRSFTHSGSKLSLPVLPNASTSGRWHINLVTMSVFLISEMWYQFSLPLLSLTSALLPWTRTTLKSTLYFGMIGTLYHNYHCPALIITFIFPDLLPKSLQTSSQEHACPTWTYACLIKHYSK